MNAREVAWRVFAEEYNSSVLEHKGEGEKPVSYIVTPLGARVNRMLVVGVVTDVEDVGEQGKPMYRARITDPTGTFYVSAGQYQPEAAASLSKISPPAFAAVVGKSRAYSPEEGVKYLSVRPETIREVDAVTRDYWVVEAAKSTLLRIDAVEDGLKMAQPSVNELVKLGYPQNLAEGVVQAIEYYKDIDLDRFRNSVREALRSILPEAEERPVARAEKPPKKELVRAKAEPMEKPEVKPEPKEGKVSAEEEETVLGMISALDQAGRGAPWDKLVEAAKAKRMDKVRLEEIVGSLMDKGEIYEPELGMMKRI